MQNTFQSDPSVSEQLNVLKLGQSDVINGNLLTLPMGGGMLYVQPVYVKSTGSTSYPTLQRVLVAFGDKIGYAATLNAALDQLFGGDSGAAAGDANVQKDPGAAGSSTQGAATPPSANGNAALAKALNDANTAMKDGQAALTKGDFTAYGEAQKRLEAAIAAALAADSAAAAPAAPSAAPSAEPSAKP